MLAGVKKIVVSPKDGLDLAGFAREGRKSAGVHDNIYVTALVLKHKNVESAIICADIIGFDRQMVKELKHEINRKFHIGEANILFNASHTHSGPQTLRNMNEAVGKLDEEYFGFLRQSVLDAVGAARGSMTAVNVYVGTDRCGVGINRRRVIDGKYEFAPYEDGIRDDTVTVIKFSSGDSVKAVLFNYACHPSTIDTDYVSADYPGKARSIIEAVLGNDTAAIFIQGCCGNIRVRTIEDNEFRSGTFEDVAEFGERLAESVLRVYNGKMRRIEKPELSGSIKEIQLKLREKPDMAEYKDIIESEEVAYRKVWAGSMIDGYDGLKDRIPYTIQKLTIGNDLVILGMEGEVCIEYALNLKNMYEGVQTVVSGYCNGIPAYIPTAEMFAQGGYEPADSIACYMLPARFDEGLEKKILKAFKDLK